jgi:hypothetical protein
MAAWIGLEEPGYLSNNQLRVTKNGKQGVRGNPVPAPHLRRSSGNKRTLVTNLV